MLSRERSFTERGIKEILESAHTGHTESSLIFRIVALQKHDSQSMKCTLEVLYLVSNFPLYGYLYTFCYNSHAFNLIFLAKDEHVDVLILYSVCWIHFLSIP